MRSRQRCVLSKLRPSYNGGREKIVNHSNLFTTSYNLSEEYKEIREIAIIGGSYPPLFTVMVVWGAAIRIGLQGVPD